MGTNTANRAAEETRAQAEAGGAYLRQEDLSAESNAKAPGGGEGLIATAAARRLLPGRYTWAEAKRVRESDV